MSVKARKSSNGKGASCVPFFVAVMLVIIIVVSVILALVIADQLHITALQYLII